LADRDQFIWLFFRLTGRVSRAAYFLGGLFIAILQAFPLYRFTLVPEGTPENQVWAIVFFIIFVASLWSNIALTVKRLHDLGKPGLWSLVIFVPIVSIVAFIVLCLFPGDPGPNRYGRRTDAAA
jgi:uncharacterized membrane protein YhaH (DUF805 family)